MKPKTTDLQIKQDHPLYTQDTETQTYGCRHTNPDICSSNSLDGTCAFITKDNICTKPPRSWKNIYRKLNGEKK